MTHTPREIALSELRSKVAERTKYVTTRGHEFDRLKEAMEAQAYDTLVLAFDEFRAASRDHSTGLACMDLEQALEFFAKYRAEIELYLDYQPGSGIDAKA